jgi:hypothetical protein
VCSTAHRRLSTTSDTADAPQSWTACTVVAGRDPREDPGQNATAVPERKHADIAKRIASPSA